MAFGMKHWIGLVLAGCALLAVAALPPRAPRIDGRVTSSAAERRAAALSSEVRRDHELLKRLRWQDSLPSLVIRKAVDGVAVVAPPQFPDSVLAAVRSQVLDEKRELGRTDPHVLFGYVFQPNDQSAQPGIHTRSTYNPWPDVMAGEAEGHPYCLAVLEVSRRTLDRPEGLRNSMRWYLGSHRTEMMGICRLVLRYGLAGTDVTSWLKAGASSFALSQNRASGAQAWRTRWNSTSSAVLAQWLAHLSPSGPLRACLARRTEACLAEARVIHPQDSSRSMAIGVFIQTHSDFLRATSPGSPPFSLAGGFLFADLEQEFGSDAFGRFWRSNEGVQQAFHDAFGVDMDTWLVRWTRRNLPTYRPGPSLAGMTALGFFVLLAICGGLAAVATAKRSVA